MSKLACAALSVSMSICVQATEAERITTKGIPDRGKPFWTVLTCPEDRRQECVIEIKISRNPAGSAKKCTVEMHDIIDTRVGQTLRFEIAPVLATAGEQAEFVDDGITIREGAGDAQSEPTADADLKKQRKKKLHRHTRTFLTFDVKSGFGPNAARDRCQDHGPTIVNRG